MATSCCDHDDVGKVTLALIQSTDGNIKYNCIFCNKEIVKSIYDDMIFIRAYNRFHDTCDHRNNDIQIYNDDECQYCGMVDEDVKQLRKTKKLKVVCDTELPY